MSYYQHLADVESDRYRYYIKGTSYFIGQSSYELRLAIYPDTEEVEFTLYPELDIKFRLHYSALPGSIMPAEVLGGDFLYRNLSHMPDLLDRQLQEFRRVYKKGYSLRVFLEHVTGHLPHSAEKICVGYQGSIVGSPERMLWLTCIKNKEVTAYFFSFHNTLTGDIVNFGTKMLEFNQNTVKQHLANNTPTVDILAEMMDSSKGILTHRNEGYDMFHSLLRQLYIDEALKEL